MLFYIIIGGLCVLVALRLLFKSSPTVQVGKGGELMLPDHWDEQAIGYALDYYRAKPAMLTHFVDNIKNRFITGQDIKTVRKRTEFIKVRIEQLQLGIEYKQLLYSLQRLQDEEEAKNERAKADLEKARLERETAIRDREGQAEIDERAREFKRIKLERKIAEEAKRIEDLSRNSQPQVSPEDDRPRQKERIQKEIERLKAEKKRVVDETEDEEEKIQWENMYDDKIQSLREQLKDYL